MPVCAILNFKSNLSFLLISRVIGTSVTKIAISFELSGATRLFGEQSGVFGGCGEQLSALQERMALP